MFLGNLSQLKSPLGKDLAVTKRQFASLKKEKEEMESELAEEIKSLLKDNDG